MAKKAKIKYKETSSDDPWIIKTWNTPTGRATIKLALYAIFILVIFMIIFFNRNKYTTEYHSVYKAVIVPYEEQLSALKENNYEYEYNITDLDNKVNFKGKKNINLDLGYKEDKNGIIKYLVENTKTYKLGVNDEKEEITNLYENIDPNYLNFNYIYSQIVNVKPSIENKDYTYNLENLKIVISTDNTKVKKIVISNNDKNYVLTYSNIGHVDNIVLNNKEDKNE